MSDTVIIDVSPALEAVDEALDILERLNGRELAVDAATVSARRDAAQERAAVKAELSYASHLLELARVQVDHQHQAITRAAKNMERRTA